MKHLWGKLIAFGHHGVGVIGEHPEPYWVTDPNLCARCGLTRRQARGKACSAVEPD